MLLYFKGCLSPRGLRPSFKRWTYLDIPTLLLALGFIFLSTGKARAGVESMETYRSVYSQHQTGLKVELFLQENPAYLCIRFQLLSKTGIL